MTQLFKKRRFCSGTKNKNNPYSSRGLDTFEALLLDLEEKRKKIYTKNDDKPGGGTSLVRFTYSSSSSNNLVPIIVKNKNMNMNVMKSDVTSSSTREESNDVNIIIRPSYYMPAVLMVLLVLLVFFGRTVAILCTSIGWYIVPAIGRGLVEEDQIRVCTSGEKKVRRMSKSLNCEIFSEKFIQSCK